MNKRSLGQTEYDSEVKPLTTTLRATILLLGITAIAGCAFDGDPTDDHNFAYVTFVNNTSAMFRLASCGEDGTDCHDEGSFPPADRYTMDVSWGIGASLFKLARPRHQPLWLGLKLPHATAGNEFWFGDASRNRTTISPNHGHVHPKPAPH